MVARAAGVAVFVIAAWVSGCIDPTLVPCGDVACPSGAMCLAGPPARCVSPEQLAACAQLGDGAPCIVSNSDGTCKNGACTTSACGNGIVDPGEACDDGNQISGDGCSGNCLSNETCGNGIVDVAVGESCDCGSPGDLAPECTQPNSDDPSAPCDSHCHARYCGDGMIDGVEQCDGSALPAGRTCADFGYYSGALSCSDLCQLDPSGCVGRCGDGVIDSVAGEFCDGVLPQGATCLSLGFDLGALTCSPNCAPALARCFELDWTTVHDSTSDLQSLWGGNGRFAVAYTDGTAFVVVNGVPSQAPGSYSFVAGAPTESWAFGATTAARWTQAGGWTTEAAPWSGANSILGAWDSPTVGTFVSVRFEGIYYRDPGGTWTEPTVPWSDDSVNILDVRAAPWVATSAGDAYSWDGAQWNELTDLSYIQSMVDDDTGRLWASNFDGTYRDDGGTWTLVAPGLSGPRMAADGDGVYLSEPYLGAFGSGGVNFLRIGDDVQIFTLGSGGVPGVTDGLGGVLTSVGSGVIAMRRGQWTGGMTIDGRLNVTDNGPPVAADSAGTEYLRGQSWYPLSTPASCSSAAVTTDGYVYCLVNNTIYDGANPIAITGAGANTRLWIGADDSTAAAADPTFFAYKTAGGWTITHPPEAFTAIAGDSLDDLYGLATTMTGAAELLHFDGATWSVVLSSLPGATITGGTQLAVTAAHVYVAGNPITVYSRSDGTTAELATPTHIFDLATTSDDEVFALTSASTAGHSPLWRYDGTSWSEVRVKVGQQFMEGVFAFRDQIFLVTTGNPSAAGVEVERLQRSAAW